MKAKPNPEIFEKAERGDFSIAVGYADKQPSSFIICCPGCGNLCSLSIRADDDRPRWTWDGNRESPTLKPSINHVGCWHGWLTAGEFTGA